MFTTAIIAFREFLEAFLIVGVFLGVSRKLNLKKEVEILLAAVIGLAFSLLLSIATYLFGDHARNILTEKNADSLESYLLIFAGFFIVYVIFSLHNAMSKDKREMLTKAHTKLQQEAFDISLFLTIIFMVVREGFEVALFTASTSIFSAFIQNVTGLLLGFAIASVFGVITFFAYVKFPIGKVFKATEYMIILLGASLVQNGITKLFLTNFNISLSHIVSFHLQFLPSEDTFIGNFFQSFFGLDNGFSLMRLVIMMAYIGGIYALFLKKRDKTLVK